MAAVRPLCSAILQGVYRLKAAGAGYLVPQLPLDLQVCLDKAKAKLLESKKSKKSKSSDCSKKYDSVVRCIGALDAKPASRKA